MCHDAAHMRERVQHRLSDREGGKWKQKTKNNQRDNVRRGRFEVEIHTHLYLPEISIKIATHFLRLGVTHCRNRPRSDTTLKRVSFVIGLIFQFHFQFHHLYS